MLRFQVCVISILSFDLLLSSVLISEKRNKQLAMHSTVRFNEIPKWMFMNLLMSIF